MTGGYSDDVVGISVVRLSRNCSFDPSEPAGDTSVSSTVYTAALMSLCLLNVCLNAVALRILPRVVPRRNPVLRLLNCLSAAEIGFNASQVLYQALVYTYGQRRSQFASLAVGLAVCSVMQALLLLHQTLHRVRNWTVVLVGWSRFGRLLRCCGGGGQNSENGDSRLSSYKVLALNVALCLVFSSTKVLEHNAIVCVHSLRLSQETTWLAKQSAYRIGYTYIVSYLTSTVAPVALLTSLHCCILRGLIRDRRQQRCQLDQQRRRQQQQQQQQQQQPAVTVSLLTASPRHGDLLIAALVATFCLCELPAFVSVFFYLHSSSWPVSHHLVHLAHLGTAIDSTLNMAIYVFPYRRIIRYCRRRREQIELQLTAPGQRRRRGRGRGRGRSEDDETAAAAAIDGRDNSPTRGFTTFGQTNSQIECQPSA